MVQIFFRQACIGGSAAWSLKRGSCCFGSRIFYVGKAQSVPKARSCSPVLGFLGMDLCPKILPWAVSPAVALLWGPWPGWTSDPPCAKLGHRQGTRGAWDGWLTSGLCYPACGEQTRGVPTERQPSWAKEARRHGTGMGSDTGLALFSKSGSVMGAAQCPRQASDKAAPVWGSVQGPGHHP